jgi:hypothetical protein
MSPESVRFPIANAHVWTAASRDGSAAAEPARRSDANPMRRSVRTPRV